MAEITHGTTERYRIFHATGVKERELPMPVARELLVRGIELDLFVKGWSEPWVCRLDRNGDMRARCPGGTAEPRVVGIDLRRPHPESAA